MKVLWIVFMECIFRPVAKLIGVMAALIYIAWCKIYKYRGAEKRVLHGLIMKDVDTLRKRLYEKLGVAS